MDAAGQGRLVNLHMAHSVHQQVGQFVGGVTPFPGHTAHAHVYKWLVSCKEFGSALAGNPHHLGHLDQHAASQLKCLEVIHASAFNVSLIIGVHILVHTSDGHAGLVFFHHQKGLNGPHCLDGFPECLGFVGRDAGIDLGDFKKLCLPFWIVLLFGQLPCVFGHPSGVNHHAFRGVND